MADYVEGAWVADFSDDQRPRIACIKEAYGEPGELLLDLVFYSRDGQRLGRVPPACGGPRSFEPACPAEIWTLIEAPDFEYVGAARYAWGDRLVKARADADAEATESPARVPPHERRGTQ